MSASLDAFCDAINAAIIRQPKRQKVVHTPASDSGWHATAPAVATHTTAPAVGTHAKAAAVGTHAKAAAGAPSPASANASATVSAATASATAAAATKAPATAGVADASATAAASKPSAAADADSDCESIQPLVDSSDDENDCQPRRTPPAVAKAAASDASDAEEPPRGIKRSRRSFSMEEQKGLGLRAVAFRDTFFAKHRTLRGWIGAFISDAPMDDIEKRKRLTEVRSAVRTLKKHGKKEPSKSGVGFMASRSTVKPSKRKRAYGAGRPHVLLELKEELWHWFVDTLNNSKARIDCQMILEQAQLIYSDMVDRWYKRVENGEIDPTQKLPAFDPSPIFAHRWRMSCRVTWRTVNLRYQISAAKRRHRCTVFWSNIIKMRAFHNCLFGTDMIRFISFDQKPFYFNYNVDSKTLTLKGRKKAGVAESVAASRERFSAMTTVASWYLGGVPPLGVMFKSKSEGRMVKIGEAPPSCVLAIPRERQLSAR